MVFLNGEFIEKNKAFVSVMDRGFLFGDGVYEVIPVYQGKIFRLNAHLKRLEHSLGSINIPNPYSNQDWRKICEQLLSYTNKGNQSIYLQITRGVASQRKHASNSLKPTIYIETNPLSPQSKQTLEKGFKAITQADIRWTHCDIKATSLLANVMYSQRAKESQVEEIILHRDKRVTEGATSNVFIIKDSTLFTHPAGGYILSGITRDLVIESAKQCQLTIQESAFTLEQLFQADEVWISSSTREIMPITYIDDQTINQGNVGTYWSCVYDYYQTLKND